MIKLFESIQGDHGAIAMKLNEVSEYCSDIKIHSVLPAQTSLGHPVMLCFIEFDFETEQNKNLFELTMRPKKMSVIKE